MENFASKESDGNFEVRISHQLELLTPEGHSVWRDEKELDVVDSCKNRRRDFFFNRLLTLPADLASGDYVLKVTIKDRVKSQVAEAIHHFEVAS